MRLIMGDSSQLARFFPKEGSLFISSRNINTSNYENFDEIFLCFGEQRTFLDLSEKDFIDVNVTYTANIINNLCEKNKKIIIYGTSELWNSYNCEISIEDDVKYNYTPYIKSKHILYDLLKENRLKNKWLNVYIIHPFNFNSVYRKEGFLFSKIYDSIINKKKISVGDLDINRDIIHTRYLVENSLNTNKDIIIGSGQLTNIKNFIKKIYNHYSLDFNEFVTENQQPISPHKKNEFWLKTTNKYNNLFNDTIYDINEYKNKIS